MAAAWGLVRGGGEVLGAEPRQSAAHRKPLGGKDSAAGLSSHSLGKCVGAAGPEGPPRMTGVAGHSGGTLIGDSVHLPQALSLTQALALLLYNLGEGEPQEGLRWRFPLGP